MEFDLSMRQAKAVFALSSMGPTSVTGLGNALSISEPTASLLVEELVVRGLAAREPDPTDRRRTMVKITDEGLDVVDRFQQSRDRHIVGWFEKLDDDELRAVLGGLQAIIHAAERSGGVGTTDKDI
jgi:DNA-binding MarR family transcriptional regulator